jgi:hypothetical protein
VDEGHNLKRHPEAFNDWAYVLTCCKKMQRYQNISFKISIEITVP